MPAKQDDRTGREKFEAYNEYGARAGQALSGGETDAAQVEATLAVAYELRNVSAAIRFGNGGRSS
jgi:hypothetical protein